MKGAAKRLTFSLLIAFALGGCAVYEPDYAGAYPPYGPHTYITPTFIAPTYLSPPVFSNVPAKHHHHHGFHGGHGGFHGGQAHGQHDGKGGNFQKVIPPR